MTAPTCKVLGALLSAHATHAALAELERSAQAQLNSCTAAGRESSRVRSQAHRPPSNVAPSASASASCPWCRLPGPNKAHAAVTVNARLMNTGECGAGTGREENKSRFVVGLAKNFSTSSYCRSPGQRDHKKRTPERRLRRVYNAKKSSPAGLSRSASACFDVILYVEISMQPDAYDAAWIRITCKIAAKRVWITLFRAGEPRRAALPHCHCGSPRVGIGAPCAIQIFPSHPSAEWLVCSSEGDVRRTALGASHLLRHGPGCLNGRFAYAPRVRGRVSADSGRRQQGGAA